MSTGDTDLPPVLLEKLEAVLFRGGDASARTQALDELMLAYPEHSESVHSWMRQVAGLGDGHLTETPPELPGYRALGKLGEGGFGDVWRCEQYHPVRRVVALKVLKLGMDSASILRRFEREQEALARMSHDAIAKIHDAGLLSTGQPFFVMELVDGLPITDWCERERLPLAARLELFVEVCHGVQHAHQKGMVHRDLKPSNVLVTMADERATPKLIDFGISRALEQSDDSLQLTESGMMLGTPAYMAPEQARGDLAAIDTRTDVYALGAILFELLTGRQAYGDWLQVQASPWELRQRILDGDTPRPSATVLGARRQESTWLRQLRGDLDWIVLKAMAKEPEHRYASAAELAADVERHLLLEPVQAGPPSASYRMRKFVRRYRIQVGAAMAVLITAVAAALVSWRWAREAEANAVLAEQRAEVNGQLAAEKQALVLSESAARADAQAAAAAAETRSRELELMADFQAEQLGSIDVPALGTWLKERLLLRVDPEQQAAVLRAFEGVDFTDLALAELEDNLFARSLQGIDRQFAEQPELRARLLQVVAETLHRLGSFAVAESPQRQALELSRRVHGDDDPRTIASIGHLAILLQALGKLDEAEPLVREAYERSCRAFGELHADSFATLNNLAFLLQGRGRTAEAEVLHRKAAKLVREALAPTDVGRLTAISNHAGCLLALDQIDEAEALLDEVGQALEANGRDPSAQRAARDRAIMMGRILAMRGRWQDAEVSLREALAEAREQLGARHPTTLRAMTGLALVLGQRQAFDEAEKLLNEALSASRLQLGPLHEETLSVQLALASVLDSVGRRPEAESMLREVYEGRMRLFGEMHSGTLASLNNLAANVLYQGRLDEAAELFGKALMGARQVLGDEHRNTLATQHNLAFLAWRSGRNEDARGLLEDLVPRLERKLGVEHRQTLQCRELLAAVFASLGDRERAVLQRLADLPLLRRSFGESDPETWACQAKLAGLLIALRRYDEATPLLEDLISSRSARLGEADPQTLQMMNDLLQAHIALEDFEAAVTVGRRAVASAARAFGDDQADTRLVRGNLAIACERAALLDEAEALLRRNETWVRSDATSSPQGKVEAGFALGKFLMRRERFALSEQTLAAARDLAIAVLGGEHELVRLGTRHLADIFEAWNRVEPSAARAAAASEWRERAGS